MRYADRHVSMVKIILQESSILPSAFFYEDRFYEDAADEIHEIFKQIPTPLTESWIDLRVDAFVNSPNVEDQIEIEGVRDLWGIEKGRKSYTIGLERQKAIIDKLVELKCREKNCRPEDLVVCVSGYGTNWSSVYYFLQAGVRVIARENKHYVSRALKHISNLKDESLTRTLDSGQLTFERYDNFYHNPDLPYDIVIWEYPFQISAQEAVENLSEDGWTIWITESYDFHSHQHPFFKRQLSSRNYFVSSTHSDDSWAHSMKIFRSAVPVRRRFNLAVTMDTSKYDKSFIPQQDQLQIDRLRIQASLFNDRSITLYHLLSRAYLWALSVGDYQLADSINNDLKRIISDKYSPEALKKFLAPLDYSITESDFLTETPNPQFETKIETMLDMRDLQTAHASDASPVFLRQLPGETRVQMRLRTLLGRRLKAQLRCRL